MDERAIRFPVIWTTFGCLVLAAFTAWALGSPELGLVLAIGAVGALTKTLASRIAIRRIAPIALRRA